MIDEMSREIEVEAKQIEIITINPATLNWSEEVIGRRHGRNLRRTYVYINGPGTELLTHSELNIFLLFMTKFVSLSTLS